MPAVCVLFSSSSLSLPLSSPSPARIRYPWNKSIKVRYCTLFQPRSILIW